MNIIESSHKWVSNSDAFSLSTNTQSPLNYSSSTLPPAQQPTHHFCYFDIRDQQTLITQSILLFFSFVICFLAIKKYLIIWRTMNDRNRNANLAYMGVMIWWISYIAKDLFGILIYVLYNQKDDVDSQLSWFSKLYFSLDWGNAFVLQTLLIFVPYHWMKQITEALSAVSGGGNGVDSQSGFEEDLPTSGYNGIQSKIHPILSIYLKIRTVSIVPIILFLVLSDYKTVAILSKILLSILLFDCCIIIVVLSLGIHSLRNTQLLKMQLDKQQSRRLFNQYLIIILSTGMRLIYDTFLVVYGAQEKLTQDNCNLRADTTWLAVVILVMTATLAHYLPVLIILRIYTMQEQPEEFSKSLIAAE